MTQLVYRTSSHIQDAYTVTDSDILWLKRAVEKEGAVQRQVAQTLCNCFCYLRATSKSPNAWTLRRLVQSYAQPVNPQWFPEGELFQAWHAKDPKTYSREAAIRRRDVHSRLMTFSPGTLDAVERALGSGPVDILPCTTDYAASWIDASHKYRPLTDPRKGENRLWSRAPTWGGYQVL